VTAFGDNPPEEEPKNPAKAKKRAQDALEFSEF
jgi:hypothetical protein